MSARAFLLFLIVPVIEVVLFFKISAMLGVFNTITILLLLSMVGVSVLKSQGLQVLVRLQEGMARGVPPGRSLLEGGLLLLTGALLIVPGFLTDAVGLALLIPPLRRFVAGQLGRHLEGRVLRGVNLGGRAPVSEPFGDLTGEVPRHSSSSEKPPIIIDITNGSGPSGPAAS